MRAAFLAALACVCAFAFSTTADAHARHYRKHHQHNSHYSTSSHHIYICAGCVIRETMAGTVAVSAENANRLVGAINALYEAGFRGAVNCAAPYGTHVAHSLHHTGDACDMAQTGWGRTPAKIMYHATAILARFGVNDGCWFGDCGHISVGARETYRGNVRHYAYRRYHYRHYAKG